MKNTPFNAMALRDFGYGAWEILYHFYSLQVSKTYGSKDGLGTREILKEEEEKQPNGKIFK